MCDGDKLLTKGVIFRCNVFEHHEHNLALHILDGDKIEIKYYNINTIITNSTHYSKIEYI